MVLKELFFVVNVFHIAQVLADTPDRDALKKQMDTITTNVQAELSTAEAIILKEINDSYNKDLPQATTDDKKSCLSHASFDSTAQCKKIIAGTIGSISPKLNDMNALLNDPNADITPVAAFLNDFDYAISKKERTDSFNSEFQAYKPTIEENMDKCVK